MAPSLYDTTVVTMKNALLNLAAVLKKGEEHAKANNMPATELEEGRLYPDMLPLYKQIVIACNTAKFYPVRVVGHEDKVFNDDLTTFAEMQARIKATIEYLDTVDRASFLNEELVTKDIIHRDFIFADGAEFASGYSLPNFFFHVVTAYDILRSKGVSIGKLDYLTGGIGAPKKVAST